MKQSCMSAHEPQLNVSGLEQKQKNAGLSPGASCVSPEGISAKR
jgi:hypothetical protein